MWYLPQTDLLLLIMALLSSTAMAITTFHATSTELPPNPTHRKLLTVHRASRTHFTKQSLSTEVRPRAVRRAVGSVDDPGMISGLAIHLINPSLAKRAVSGIPVSSANSARSSVLKTRMVHIQHRPGEGYRRGRRDT